MIILSSCEFRFLRIEHFTVLFRIIRIVILEKIRSMMTAATPTGPPRGGSNRKSLAEKISRKSFPPRRASKGPEAGNLPTIVNFCGVHKSSRSQENLHEKAKSLGSQNTGER